MKRLLIVLLIIAFPTSSASAQVRRRSIIRRTHATVATSTAATVSRAFDGASYLSHASAATWNFDRANTFSVSAWVYITLLPDGSSHAILSKRDTAGVLPGWEFRIRSIGGAWKLEMGLVNDAFAPNQVLVNSTNSLAQNQWAHVAMTYSGNSLAAGVKLYINGVLETNVVTTDALSATIATARPLNIGARNSTDDFWTGWVSDVRIWNTTLAGADITSLNSCTSSVQDASLVGKWILGNGASPEPDSTSGANDLTVTGATTVAIIPCPSATQPYFSFDAARATLGAVSSTATTIDVLNWTKSGSGTATVLASGSCNGLGQQCVELSTAVTLAAFSYLYPGSYPNTVANPATNSGGVFLMYTAVNADNTSCTGAGQVKVNRNGSNDFTGFAGGSVWADSIYGAANGTTASNLSFQSDFDTGATFNTASGTIMTSPLTYKYLYTRSGGVGTIQISVGTAASGTEKVNASNASYGTSTTTTPLGFGVGVGYTQDCLNPPKIQVSKICAGPTAASCGAVYP